jgi:uncharacterized protein YndB with AHSA1/START domain
MLKKSLVLASPDRVWAALTDLGQLATWFGAEIRSPLVAGAHEAEPRGAHVTVAESAFEGTHGELLERAVEASTSGWATQLLQLELFLSGAIDLRPIKD